MGAFLDCSEKIWNRKKSPSRQAHKSEKKLEKRKDKSVIIMDEAEFHKLRARVIEVEGNLVWIAQDIIKRAFQGDVPKANPGREGDNVLAEDVSEEHHKAIIMFSGSEGIEIPVWRAGNYVAEVYGPKSAEFDRKNRETYYSKAASRQKLVPLIRGHFTELNEPYVLNTGAPIPEGMELLARWARIHPGLSVDSISEDLDRVADAAFVEMTAATLLGADPAEVIEIHRQELYGLIDERCIDVPQFRVNQYLGCLYKCGIFNPLRVDEGAEGKPSYTERLHLIGSVANFVANEFPVKAPKRELAGVQ